MMKILFFIFILVFSSNLFSAGKPSIQQLKTGTYNQKITAIHYFGYSKNKLAFWHLVKYLSKKFKVNDSTTGVKLRSAAAESLGRLMDDRCIPFLIKAYNNENEVKVKKAIIFATAYFKDASLNSIIEDALKSNDTDLIIEALESIADNNIKLIDQINKIKNTDSNRKLLLVKSYALVRLNSNADENIKILKDNLKNRKGNIRYWASYYISQTDRIDAIPDIIKALEIENFYWVRRELNHCLDVLTNIRR